MRNFHQPNVCSGNTPKRESSSMGVCVQCLPSSIATANSEVEKESFDNTQHVAVLVVVGMCVIC